ncbi:alpha-1,3-rhamnosyltransferase [Candidatus Magnetomoraceae bacterium gMMP-13]
MQTDSPLVSILLCVYNGELYLKEAIDSIIAQTHTNWELIIVDDGSTDSTSAILKSYSDPRIRLHYHQNMGLTKSLNVAAKLAKGELFARQDADDISLPERLEQQVKIFIENPNVILSASDTVLINGNGETMGTKLVPLNTKDALKKILSLKNPFVHGSLMFRRDAFEKAGGYNERFTTTQDFELIFRMSLIGEFACVPNILYKLRVHEQALTSKKWIIQIVNTLKCAKLINNYYPGSILYSNLLNFISKKVIVGFISFFSPDFFYFYRMKYTNYKKALSKRV